MFEDFKQLLTLNNTFSSAQISFSLSIINRNHFLNRHLSLRFPTFAFEVGRNLSCPNIATLFALPLFFSASFLLLRLCFNPKSSSYPFPLQICSLLLFVQKFNHVHENKCALTFDRTVGEELVGKFSIGGPKQENTTQEDNYYQVHGTRTVDTAAFSRGEPPAYR